MGKCWMIKSEDEFIGEGTFITIGGVNHYFPGARITEYPSNPLEPILEVWGKWKDKTEEVFNPAMLVCEFWEAIEKCMVIVEGK